MDKKNHNKSKITLGMLKGKPIMSSVPSISIRFNANAEEIDDLFGSDTERGDAVGEIGCITTTISDNEGSPAKQTINSKLTKRSTSIDASNPIDASPPSDPWRFFTDIKGKITKSVEGKLTEYKTRSVIDGEGSPKTSKPSKEAKESSSLSDSEELSESSISRTCGIVSTTEGAEMSSDDETPSLSEKDKKDDLESSPTPVTVKRKFRVVKNKETKAEGLMSGGFLQNLQNINMGLQTEDQTDVESGVDALLQLENVEMDGDDILIRQTNGSDIRNSIYNAKDHKERTVLAPTGYVDLRPPEKKPTWFCLLSSFRYYILAAICILLYITIPLSPYTTGFISGTLIMLTATVFYVKVLLNPLPQQQRAEVPILEIPPVQECQPPTKYEGWVNEYPEEYNPYSYHISQTQAVYLRLQGNLLKISHTVSKIPKRAMWNEAKHKMVFTKHRIYNLLGAQITLLPFGLTKIRHWSKKYPISIKLEEKYQFNFDYPEKREKKPSTTSAPDETETNSPHKKWKKVDECQVFSKLSDEKQNDPVNSQPKNEELESALNLQKDGGDKSESELEASQDNAGDNTSCQESCMEDETNSEFDDLSNYQVNGNGDLTSIYIFARTDREKEHWYKRLITATHTEPNSMSLDNSPQSSDDSDKTDHTLHEEYLKFMSKFSLLSLSDNTEPEIDTPWINALVTRVAFDLIRNQAFIGKMKERIQRKLSAIKLPYFIEELTLTELSLGNTPPFIRNVGKPVMDDWGLWIDLHLTYEGHVIIILQTKLNLMKLKQPPISTDKKCNEKSPIFHSDVDDTAESSSDDDGAATLSSNIQGPLDSSGHPVPGLGGTSNKGKRLIKMVDRIAESKFFQAATENKYIKKAIEGVSNTDLGLKVELRSLDGHLVLNIPTPPSDRVWVGFRPTPKLVMNAHPIVGERNINFLKVTGWIERKLYKEFQKLLVIPNMEDLHIPVMMQMLPK